MLNECKLSMGKLVNVMGRIANALESAGEDGVEINDLARLVKEKDDKENMFLTGLDSLKSRGWVISVEDSERSVYYLTPKYYSERKYNPKSIS